MRARQNHPDNRESLETLSRRDGSTGAQIGKVADGFSFATGRAVASTPEWVDTTNQITRKGMKRK